MTRAGRSGDQRGVDADRAQAPLEGFQKAVANVGPGEQGRLEIRLAQIMADQLARGVQVDRALVSLRTACASVTVRQKTCDREFSAKNEEFVSKSWIYA